MNEDYSELNPKLKKELASIAAGLKNDSVSIQIAERSLTTGDADENTKLSSPLHVENVSLEIDSPPPPGVESGGVWGSSTHCGERTKISSFFCLLVPCWCIPIGIHCCLPFDKRRVYKSVTGTFFDPEGNVITNPGDFMEGELDYPIDRDRRKRAYNIIAAVYAVLVLLFTYLIVGIATYEHDKDFAIEILLLIVAVYMMLCFGLRIFLSFS